MTGLLDYIDDLLRAERRKSVTDPRTAPQRSVDEESRRGSYYSLLGSGAGLADAAQMTMTPQGRMLRGLLGMPTTQQSLTDYMGDPDAPDAPAGYAEGARLMDVLQMVTPAGLLNAAPRAAKAPSSLLRQTGAVGDLDPMLTARNKAARRNATIPETSGGLGLGSRNTAEQRAAAQGYESGWWRGGPEPTITPTGTTPATGNWYTRDPQAAAAYARGADTREYAVRGPMLDAMAPADPTKLRALADALDAEKLAPSIARELRAIGANEGHSGRGVYSGLAAQIGEQKAAELMQRIGYRGITNLNNGGDLLMFAPGAVRDAKRAAFDPTKLGRNDIFASVAPYALTGGLLGGGWITQEPK